MKKGYLPDCANCGLTRQEKACLNLKGKGVKGCPTLTKKKLTGQAKKEYQLPKVREFARQASIQEGECYAGRDEKPFVMHATKPRIQEIVEFARKMGYSRSPDNRPGGEGQGDRPQPSGSGLLIGQLLFMAQQTMIGSCLEVNFVPKSKGMGNVFHSLIKVNAGKF